LFRIFMTAKYPKFMPILSSYTSRVSGRSSQELLASPAGLARALADTQRVVGHDGVLCFYAPHLQARSCVQSAGSLCSADDAPQSGSLAAVLEAIAALRTTLPSGVHICACFPGPELMLAELRRSCLPNPPELSDYDYVGDVFLSLVRAACEAGAHGVAIAEDLHGGECAPESCFRSARKLVDFYSAALVAFLEPGSDAAGALAIADFVFKLPADPGKLELLGGAANGFANEKTPMTTNKDVPIDVSVEELRVLRALAMN
jgi:hypothetical protein